MKNTKNRLGNIMFFSFHKSELLQNTREQKATMGIYYKYFWRAFMHHQCLSDKILTLANVS